jgi:2-isopropylmalate synthase
VINLEERALGLITDWNDLAAPHGPQPSISVHDETLRDGLQSPSVLRPSIDARLELLHLMSDLGIESADLGMPISSPSALRHVTRLASAIRSERLLIRPTCAARTTRADITAVANVAQASGVEIEVMAFVGISPMRLYVERWILDNIVAEIRALVAFALSEGLRVCLVTEDTTRARLDAALTVYAAALEAGADRICVCDTAGFALPWGAAELIRSLRGGLVERGFPDVLIDWHGHNDRGLGMANSLAAAAAGANRLHGTALGIGERAGNTSMEQLLVNLHDMGHVQGNLKLLSKYCALTAEACGLTVPVNQPFVGADAYRTATGVHAAAIRKALGLGDLWAAERIYSGIPASRLGRKQHIEVGPDSGRSNILYWLDLHGFEHDPVVVAVLMEAIANATRTYADEELLAVVNQARAGHRTVP